MVSHTSDKYIFIPVTLHSASSCYAKLADKHYLSIFLANFLLSDDCIA